MSTPDTGFLHAVIDDFCMEQKLQITRPVYILRGWDESSNMHIYWTNVSTTRDPQGFKEAMYGYRSHNSCYAATYLSHANAQAALRRIGRINKDFLNKYQIKIMFARLVCLVHEKDE